MLQESNLTLLTKHWALKQNRTIKTKSYNDDGFDKEEDYDGDDADDEGGDGGGDDDDDDDDAARLKNKTTPHVLRGTGLEDSNAGQQS